MTAWIRAFLLTVSQSQTTCLARLHSYHNLLIPKCPSPSIQAIPWAFEVFYFYLLSSGPPLIFFARAIHCSSQTLIDNHESQLSTSSFQSQNHCPKGTLSVYRIQPGSYPIFSCTVSDLTQAELSPGRPLRSLVSSTMFYVAAIS